MGSVEERKMKFSELKADLLRRREIFVDRDFPAGPSAITADKRRSSISSATNDIEWKRPQDISDDPKFVVEGATRFDLHQGDLGNCWFVAATGCLAAGPKKLFEWCVPTQDQDFKRNYAGIFMFRFWNFGHWVEVFVDDLLPCRRGTRELAYAHNLTQPNEFWVPLFEKAYAKLNGCYGNLDGGFSSDALVDFTGGISEFIDIISKRRSPENLYETLQTMDTMSSLIGTHINAPTPQELPNGLYKGHAYSVTKIEQVGGDRLLRLHNPWGKGEWKGRWSDGSREWSTVSENDKRRLEVEKREDGEFWISFDDWLQNFETLTICHLYPDAIAQELSTKHGKHMWESETFQSEWVRDFTAGGAPGQASDRYFWQNPQFLISVKPSDCGKDGKRHVVVSLMQKAQGTKWTLEISYAICQLRDDAPLLPFGRSYGPEAVASKDVGVTVSRREVSSHCSLPPGNYLIVPFTRQFKAEGEFVLRIFMELQQRQA